MAITTYTYSFHSLYEDAKRGSILSRWLPTVQHHLVHVQWAPIGASQPLPSEEKVADLDGREPVPGDLAEGVDLPENDTVAPHVRGSRELSPSQSFGSRPG
jgi:hypothetical protein